ncbi:P-loop NTPase [Jiella marina]|uniref:P-loop NTPase n=1 Tax=Jiella sp. LLJ827 TaxID=2917712 RepID=UPI0021010800|nr:SIR2 family protein [Jiella sp. LLJ827]MCQ0987560.1 SIR2 family protein [Jiella sp. LLJ827]
MPFTKITGKQEAAIKSALRAGQYNLLLGAGFSMDSTNEHGKLPSGEALAAELSAVTKAKSNSLQRLYELMTPQQVKTHITDRLSCSVPGKTARLMSSFIWKRVFTWNVDDVLENAYKDGKGHQRLVPKHFNDIYTNPASMEELFLIHLHGYVGQADRGYVFSREQYLNQIMKVNPWMTVLTQFMLSEPMIIAGTSLDEVDLDFYLAQRTSESARNDRGPSILVASDGPFSRKLCEKHDLLLFDGWSVEFFEYLKTLLPSAPTPTELIPLEARKLLPAGVSKATAMAFNSDFEIVPGSAPQASNSRFMYGHIPSWSDLESNLDITRPIVAEMLLEAEKRIANPLHASRIMFIGDVAGAGKTTVLRRVAFELARRGVRTLLCSALSRIGAGTADVLNLIDDPVVVIIDNLAEQATAVVDLVARLKKADILFIGAERAYRGNYLKQVLAPVNYDEIGKLPMSRTEARRLIDRYVDAGAIGDRTILRHKDKFVLEVQQDPIAVVCCRILNDFRPLNRILDSITTDAGPEAFDRYLGAALAQHCFYGGVRYEILMKAFGTKGSRTQFGPSNPLPLDFYDDAKRFVIPENAVLAESILDRVAERDPDKMLRIFIELAEELGAWVNRETIKARAPEARLSGRLFDFDAVVGKYLKGNAEALYDKVQYAWEWNSRYWEQVALLNLARYQMTTNNTQRMEYLENAVTHARHAVAVEHHPFPLTTLGKVLVGHMLAPGVNMQPSFDEAFRRLSEAIEIEERRNRVAAQPYGVIFSGVLSYLDAGGQMDHNQLARLQEIVSKASAKLGHNRDMQQQVIAVKQALTQN